MNDNMSVQTIKEASKIASKSLERTISFHVQGSRFIIPFLTVFPDSHPGDIYTGEESIPFEKRDPLYKSILRKEFSNAIKEFSKTINNVM